MSIVVDHVRAAYRDKQTHVVLFSSTAIALYGYDQGMVRILRRIYHLVSVWLGKLHLHDPNKSE